MKATDARRRGAARALRPSSKLLPEYTRAHNRSLVLQTLYRDGPLSRADISRSTELTRVTVSDLVAELIDESFIVERGLRDESRPGKRATMLEIDRTGHQMIAVDLSDDTAFRAAIVNLGGEFLERCEVPIDGALGNEALAKALAVIDMARALATAPLLGIGVGSPGVIDDLGVVRVAVSLGWTDVNLRSAIEQQTGLPVSVMNDVNVAVLAEHGFGDIDSDDIILVRIGQGVGAGVIVGGATFRGSRFWDGEIGHVTVGTGGGPQCRCGRTACLEAWVGVPRLTAELDRLADEHDQERFLRDAGEHLGIALAPIVRTLDLADVVLSGPADLLGGAFLRAAHDTLLERTMIGDPDDLSLRMTTLGRDNVLFGAVVLVLTGQLGVS
ncbi:ROK family transcriptional regulator [Paramicrobacterium chengjingii]|uniref:ROK family transcriptional regulator n=1 Tax=Paramicrobacterium chengjingii TaxID=2769067 RepID=A0ABX6YK91_9MICO|nr:ROK family transcriptional regulator [Microbacterium chengjingii]QPZ39224.1 ROK family transcriptional regulator [Microbacterium chengjingii]